jgi:hypothetical protein
VRVADYTGALQSSFQGLFAKTAGSGQGVSRVVDQHVESAEASLTGVDHPRVVVANRHVGADAVRARRPGHLFYQRFVPDREHNVMPGLARQLHNRGADALTTTRHQKAHIDEPFRAKHLDDAPIVSRPGRMQDFRDSTLFVFSCLDTVEREVIRISYVFSGAACPIICD